MNWLSPLIEPLPEFLYTSYREQVNKILKLAVLLCVFALWRGFIIEGLSWWYV